jgi:PilZ domain
MRPLTTSIPRLELSRILDLSPELLDALLENGRVLCHMKRGQPHVPLEQLEGFFRDMLLRIYRVEVEREGRQFGDSDTEVSDMPDPVALAADADAEAAAASEVADEQPAPIVEPAPPPAPIVRASPPSRPAPRHISAREQRGADRYFPLRRLAGIFGDTKFTILQISANGLRIRHNDTLVPGDEAKLSFALLMPARSVVVRARVVWTSIAKAGDEQFGISGLRIIEHQDRLERAVEDLKAAHELQPERRGRMRRAIDGAMLVNDISDEEMALVTAAVERFASDPIEASRWYSRARFALSDENVRRAAPRRPREREEVLGIWEYLDRQIDISKIAGVVSWMRE